MYDYMLKNTDPDKVFFQMDVYWVGEGGKDPVEYFNNYPGRFEVLHIKEMCIRDRRKRFYRLAWIW